MSYYVYAHIRLDNNEIFYVGKGCGNRKNWKWGRNKHWNNVVQKYGYRVEVLFDNLNEAEAFEKEKEVIKTLKDQQKEIVNYTNGGDGVSGYTHSQKTRQKIREKAIGRKYGTETREKRRQSMLGKNKGDKNCMKNPETVEKMRKSKMGKSPWNKGLKGAQVAWNKGLSNEKTRALAERARQYRKLVNTSEDDRDEQEEQ